MSQPEPEPEVGAVGEIAANAEVIPAAQVAAEQHDQDEEGEPE